MVSGADSKLITSTNEKYNLIQNKILTPIANLMISKGVMEGGTINVSLKAGEFVFRDGDASSEMCLILKGNLSVYRKD